MVLRKTGPFCSSCCFRLCLSPAVGWKGPEPSHPGGPLAGSHEAASILFCKKKRDLFVLVVGFHFYFYFVVILYERNQIIFWWTRKSVDQNEGTFSQGAGLTGSQPSNRSLPTPQPIP